MRHPFTMFVLIGGLAGSAVALAATPGQADSALMSQLMLTTRARMHAVRGVVKKVDAACLVITRTSRTRTDLSFSLTPSTLQQGTIAAGSTVYVRYRIEDDELVATAVVAR